MPLLIPPRNIRLGQYYTANAIGNLLVDRMSTISPKTVLELGVGGGALFKAAVARWSDATLISVDVDIHNVDNIRTKYPSHIHLHSDAIAEEISISLQPYQGLVDVAICNPPYIRKNWQKSFGVILEEAGLSGVIPKIRNTAADIIFLAQNLRMLRMGGELGIIVPDGVVTSQLYLPLRNVLLHRFAIKNVIQLPRGVFNGTDVRAFIVTLNKSEPKENIISLYSSNEFGCISQPIQITRDLAIGRMDFDFHYWQQNSRCDNARKNIILSETSEIKRGSIENAYAKKMGIAVFHTTNFKDIKDRSSFNVPNTINVRKGLFQNHVIAEAGDIILARVGRSLENQVAYINRGRILLTDCVYRIRSFPAVQPIVWAALSGSGGRAWLRAHAKGTGARVLAKKDFNDFRIFNYRE